MSTISEKIRLIQETCDEILALDNDRNLPREEALNKMELAAITIGLWATEIEQLVKQETAARW